MNLIYTNHARRRMDERRISSFLVEATLASFDKHEGYGDDYRVFKKLPTGDHMVVGAAKSSRGEILITTVFIRPAVQ